MSKFCQSCGMPLAKDEQGSGTEADGSKSAKYCSHCYEHGAFKDPNMTMAEMQTLVDGKLREVGAGRIMRWFSKRMIPKLERWKS
ncbi:MAG: zinc ribbon domain-containing protein [Patescibacteria group bacterium]